MTERILVTGAAGCVGTFVVDVLLTRGHTVVAADRPQALAALEARARTEPRLVPCAADLTKPEDCARAAEGATAVIHTAAIVDIARSFEELRPINLDAVRWLYDAARANGAHTFVHFSTGSVYAPKSDGTPLDETSPVTAGNAYVRTKLLSEDYLASRPDGGPRIAILRPSLIFGPRGKVLAAALAAVPVLLGSVSGRALPITGGPRTNWVHAIDVARAAVFLLEHDEIPTKEIFNVANDDALPIGELFSEALRASGLDVRGPALPYPTGLVRAFAPLVDRDAVFGTINRIAARAWSKVQDAEHLERELVPRIDREALPYAFRDTIFSNAKLKARGFELTHAAFASGWRDTVDWYTSARWLPTPAALLPARGEVRS
ncbi:NAD(P)-dependent oxidoreductase [Myxococcota bacterium]|nr:NAD(P)-dependent oxidoreductase [Myxococcota bacterium]